MRISELLNASKPLTIKFVAGEKEIDLHVTYRTSPVTYRAIKGGEGLEGWDKAIHNLVTYLSSWDLTDDAGVMIPITKEGIEDNDIPIEVITSIMVAINADMKVDPDSKND